MSIRYLSGAGLAWRLYFKAVASHASQVYVIDLLFQVVECMDSVNQTPLTGILQPLTAVSATLTLVKTPFLPVLEKLMAFGQSASSQTHPGHIRKFIEKSAASILGPYKAKQQELIAGKFTLKIY